MSPPPPREAEELRRGAGAEEGILDLNEDDLRFDELAPETGLMDPPLAPPFLDDDAIAIYPAYEFVRGANEVAEAPLAKHNQSINQSRFFFSNFGDFL